MGERNGWPSRLSGDRSVSGNAARKPRVSYTNRARLALLLTPIWLPLTLLWWIACSFGAAASEWWETFSYGVADTRRLLYREVYRPARYGSVFDAE